MHDFAQYWVGADLGQMRDFTGLAVVERAEVPGEWDPTVFATRIDVRLSLRYLERVPLGTPYPEVVERVRQVTELPDLRGRCQLVVDATGVGVPVVDMLRGARLNCGLLPVMITGGQLEGEDKGYHMVPKRDLVIGLQVLLQQRKLRIAGGMRFGATLQKEMADMQVKISLAGREQYGTWREGEHDDLVLAVAMACWGVKKMYPKELEGEDAYFRRRIGHPDLRRAVGENWRP